MDSFLIFVRAIHPNDAWPARYDNVVVVLLVDGNNTIRSGLCQYQLHKRETNMTKSMATVVSKCTPPEGPMRRTKEAKSAVRANWLAKTSGM